MRLNIYPERCTGCSACEVFCSLHHEGLVNQELSRIHVYRDIENANFLPIACVNCQTKACLAACPEEGAIYINHLGMVVIEEQLCTGCSKCKQACEIQAIGFYRQTGRGKMGKAFCFKCDLCDGEAVCVNVCPVGALVLEEDTNGDAGQRLFETLRPARLEIVEHMEARGMAKTRRVA
ncbi:MAG: 4Fe-4S dicluster domain-containing protein [Anaerolineales bacterium]|nr:4Fe-4S dicluster domain-containing protein [Anaerolineales bacterium]